MSKLTYIAAKFDNRFLSFDQIKLDGQDLRRYYNYIGDDLIPKGKPKFALLSYLSAPFYIKKNPKFFNPNGTVIEIANILNKLGYSVDIINLWDKGFIVNKEYDIFIGHCNSNYKYIFNQLSHKTIKYLYINTCSDWAFTKQTEERYNRCRISGKIPETTRPNRVSSMDRETLELADRIICLGKETAKTFENYLHKIIPINNAVYFEKPVYKRKGDLTRGKNNYIFLSGTGGNIQKGTDLIIEAFAKMPEKNLYIFCKLDNEILDNFKAELQLPNISYVYPLRFSKTLKTKLIKKTNFLIGAGLLSGQGTAFIGGMQSGLIPLLTKAMDIEILGKDFYIPTECIEDIISSVNRLSCLPNEDLMKMHEETLRYVSEKHSVDNFRSSFRNAITQEIVKIPSSV